MLYSHLHVMSWIMAFILVTCILLSHLKGKEKATTIIQWINRMNYLVIVYSGGMLLYRYTQSGIWSTYGIEVIVKSLAGLWVIVAIELLLHRFQQKKSLKGITVQLVLGLMITLTLGFGRLPWGFLP